MRLASISFNAERANCTQTKLGRDLPMNTMFDLNLSGTYLKFVQSIVAELERRISARQLSQLFNSAGE
jgi:hypothetical protein